MCQKPPPQQQALSTVDDLHREGLASDIHQGLLVLQGNISDSWRCQQHLAAALPHLPGLLAAEALAEHWVPYAFSLLLNGTGLYVGAVCNCSTLFL